MAGRHAERSQSRSNSVSPISKGKLARQIYIRARYFASGASRQRFVQLGSEAAALTPKAYICTAPADVRFAPESGHDMRLEMGARSLPRGVPTRRRKSWLSDPGPLSGFLLILHSPIAPGLTQH